MISLYEYDRASHMALIKEEAFEDGIQEGILKGVEDGKSQMQQRACETFSVNNNQ